MKRLKFAVTCLVVGLASVTVFSGMRSITERKPTGEAVLILGADANIQRHVSCPECGLTYFVDVQLRGTLITPVLTMTYWYDSIETAKKRRRIFIPSFRE